MIAFLVLRSSGSGDSQLVPTRSRGLLAPAASGHSRERMTSSVKSLPLGQVRLEIVARHPASQHWGGQIVRWDLGGVGHLKRVRTGRARETEPGVTRMTTTVAMARAGRFRFVAFRGPGRAPYVGTGIAPAGYPRAGAIAAAASYLAHRSGYTSFAVIDSDGRITAGTCTAPSSPPASSRRCCWSPISARWPAKRKPPQGRPVTARADDPPLRQRRRDRRLGTGR